MSRGYDDDRGGRGRDDFDDRGGRRELTGLDKFYATTGMPVLIIFSLCCGGIALILGLVGMFTCTDETAKGNAKLTVIISGILVALNIVVWIIMMATGAAMMGGK